MIWHVIPLSDIKEHIEKTTCDCHPYLEEQSSGDFICVHNSYDDREYREISDG